MTEPSQKLSVLLACRTHGKRWRSGATHGAARSLAKTKDSLVSRTGSAGRIRAAMKRDTIERYANALAETPADPALLRRIASDLGAAMAMLRDLADFNKSLPSLLIGLNRAAKRTEGDSHGVALMIAAIGFGFGRSTSRLMRLVALRRCRSTEATDVGDTGIAIGVTLAELDAERSAKSRARLGATRQRKQGHRDASYYVVHGQAPRRGDHDGAERPSSQQRDINIHRSSSQSPSLYLPNRFSKPTLLVARLWRNRGPSSRSRWRPNQTPNNRPARPRQPLCRPGAAWRGRVDRGARTSPSRVSQGNRRYSARASGEQARDGCCGCASRPATVGPTQFLKTLARFNQATTATRSNSRSERVQSQSSGVKSDSASIPGHSLSSSPPAFMYSERHASSVSYGVSRIGTPATRFRPVRAPHLGQ